MGGLTLGSFAEVWILGVYSGFETPLLCGKSKRDSTQCVTSFLLHVGVVGLMGTRLLGLLSVVIR